MERAEVCQDCDLSIYILSAPKWKIECHGYGVRSGSCFLVVNIDQSLTVTWHKRRLAIRKWNFMYHKALGIWQGKLMNTPNSLCGPCNNKLIDNITNVQPWTLRIRRMRRLRKKLLSERTLIFHGRNMRETCTVGRYKTQPLWALNSSHSI